MRLGGRDHKPGLAGALPRELKPLDDRVAATLAATAAATAGSS